MTNLDIQLIERQRLEIFKAILPYDKVILNKPVENISKIVAVVFTETFEGPYEDWNEYVDYVKKTIGIKSYCEWIYDDKRKITGLMAFYDKQGEEIKMKYFKNWQKLLNVIKTKI